jgi:hypothetical protein
MYVKILDMKKKIVLKYLIENNIKHFVIKYFEYVENISDFRIEKYQVFIDRKQQVDLPLTWYNESYYPTLRNRNLNERELMFFKESIENYTQERSNKYGKVFVFKQL